MSGEIELEVRGECTGRYEELKQKLDALSSKSGKAPEHFVRTSVMCFGRMGEMNVDVRCRVTNGVSEVVAKIGDFHAHDRREYAVDVDTEQMIAFARLFAGMGFSHVKVGTRTTWKYDLDGVEVALACGQSPLAYIEFEKMVESKDVEVEKEKLEELAKEIGTPLWSTSGEYLAFCKRLTDDEDWSFSGSEEDVKRLREQILSTKSA